MKQEQEDHMTPPKNTEQKNSVTPQKNQLFNLVKISSWKNENDQNPIIGQNELFDFRKDTLQGLIKKSQHDKNDEKDPDPFINFPKEKKKKKIGKTKLYLTQNEVSQKMYDSEEFFFEMEKAFTKHEALQNQQKDLIEISQLKLQLKKETQQKKRIDLDLEKYESIEQILKRNTKQDQMETEASMKKIDKKKSNRFLHNIMKIFKKLKQLCESEEGEDEDTQEKFLEHLKTKYCGLSFNYFRIDNPIRLFLLKLIENAWFDRVVILVIAINSCFLAFNDYTWKEENGQSKPIGNHLVDDSELFFSLFFLLEFCIKVICQGIIFADGCYFRDGWNWLDFIVVVTAILQVLPKVANVSAIRMFRFLRPLRTLSIYPSMKILAETLFSSLAQLINIIILDSIFIFIFSILALQLWGGVTNFRCRQTPRPVDGDWLVVFGDVRLCGGFNQCGEGTYCGSLYETYLPDLDNPGQMKQYQLSQNVSKNLNRDSLISELNYGITNFDNVTSSFLTTFQCTTLEGWFQIMEMIQDSYDIYTSSFFFIVLIIICFYFLLNLTVAVMLDEFKQLNKETTFSYTQTYENNRIRVQNLRALHCDIQDFEEGKPQYLKQIKKFFKRNFIRKFVDPRNQEGIVKPDDQEKNIKKEVNRYDYRICRIAWNIIRQPIFNHFVMLLIIINSIALASDSYPQNDMQQFFQDTNIYFSIGICIEQILKLIGLTWVKYIKDKFNIIDFVIILVSIIELIFTDSSGVLITIRTFRLIRLVKLARSNNDIKILLDSVAKTLIAIGNFLLLLSLFIYIFALLGMSQFAGSNFDQPNNQEIDPSYKQLRTNFDTIQTSLITVFQVLIGEDWDYTMYEVYKNVGHLSYIYFFILIIFGKTILLNLFLSILLGNFELSSLITRAQEEDMRLKRIEKRIFARNQKLQEQSLFENQSSSESFSNSLDYDEDENQKLNIEDQEKQQLQANRAEEIAQINKSIILFRISEKKRQSMFIPDLENLNLFRAKTLDLMPEIDQKKFLEIDEGQALQQPQTAELAKIKFKQRQTLKLSKSQSQKLNFDFDKKVDNFLDIKRLGTKNVAFDLSSDENSDIKNSNAVDQPTNKDNDKNQQNDVQQVFGALIQNNKKLDMQKLFNLSKPLVPKQENILKANQIFPIQFQDKDFDFENSSINSSLNLQEIVKNKRIHAETQLQNNKKMVGLQLQGFQTQQKSNDCQSGRVQQLDSSRKLLHNCDTDEKINEKTQIALKIDIKQDPTFKFQKKLTPSKNDYQADEMLDNPEQAADNFSEQLQPNSKIHSQSQQSFFQKIVSYLKCSSLFIFHKDTILRQLLLKIATKQQINKKQDQQKQSEENIDELLNDNSEDDFANLFGQIDEDVKDIRIFFGEAIHVRQVEPKKEEDDNIGEKDTQTPNTGSKHIHKNISQKVLNDSLMIEKLTIEVERVEEEFENVIISEGQIQDLQQIQKRVNAKVNYLNRLNAKGEIDLKIFNELNKKQQEAVSKVQEIYDVYLKRLELMKKLTSNKRCEDWFLCVNWSLNTWFENFIQLTIFCSLLILINDVPNVDPNKQYVSYLKIADRCISFIFFSEAFVRIVALGFFYTSLQGQKAYIMDPQNRIDFFVCICCDLPFQILQSNLSESPIKNFNSVLRSLKVLRSLRALRILRVISKSEALRIAVGSLFEAMPSIINGLIICSLFIFIFAIIGVNFFKGAFFKCIFDENKYSQDEIKTLISLIDTKEDCIKNGGSWTNSRHNFDNVLNGMSILYQIITTEGWLEYMYAGIDSRGPDLQPKRNYNLGYSAYFISFMLIGNIFIFKLFVGIVIEKFSRLKDKSNGFTLMTRDQRAWLEQEKSMLKLVLKPVQRISEDFLQQQALKLLKTDIFRHLLSATIICNFLIMSLVHYQQSENWNNAILKGQIVLIIIYNFEAVIKIVSKKQYYFQNFANKFDFFIVVFGNIIIIVRFSVNDEKLVTQILNILMVFPLIRIFRIINSFYQYKILIGSLKIIFPAVANVGCLILLIIFMFAVIGMNMFSNVIYQAYLNENMNFNYFGLAVICLIRCMTGEKWNFIMDELAIDNTTQVKRNRPDGTVYSEYCLEQQSYEDVQLNGPKLCGNQFSYFYFSCFIIVIQMMMLNLFIAVVLEGFSSANKDFTSAVTNEDYKNFVETWLEYDPDATGWLCINDLVFFLNDLPSPFNKIIKVQENEDSQIVNQDSLNKKKHRLIDKKDRFLLHSEKNFIISHKQAMSALNDIKLPVYKSDQPGVFKVHFCFVVKRLTHKVMVQNNPEFDASKMSIKHLIQSQKKWEETYPDLVKDLAIFNYDTGRIFAALFILMCTKTLLQKKKMLIQGDAYNLIKKERQIVEERENQQRKAKIFQQIKRERLQKKLQLYQATISKKISRSKSEDIKQSKEKLKPKSNDIAKLLKYKKKPKTDDIIVLEKKNKKRQEEMEREDIDREFIKSLNDKILKTEKNKKSFKKLPQLIQKLIIQQLKGNMKLGFQQLVDVQKKNQAKEDEQKKWNDPLFKKDFERSTWFLENNEKNRKMKQWVQNFYVKERFKKLTINNENLSKISQIKDVDQLFYLEQNEEQEHEPQDYEIFEVGINDNIQDYDPKKVPRKKKPKLLEVQKDLDLTKQPSEQKKEVHLFKNSTKIIINNLESAKQDKNQEMSQDFEELGMDGGGDRTWKEYPQGEIVSSIELSNEDIQNQSILSSLDEMDQVKINLNIRKLI